VLPWLASSSKANIVFHIGEWMAFGGKRCMAVTFTA
jgi:hypothetical protein